MFPDQLAAWEATLSIFKDHRYPDSSGHVQRVVKQPVHILLNWDNTWHEPHPRCIPNNSRDTNHLLFQQQANWDPHNFSINNQHYLGPDAKRHDFVACQQMCIPVCAYTHSERCLCYWLSGKYNDHTWYTHHFTILASLCSWAGWLEP